MELQVENTSAVPSDAFKKVTGLDYLRFLEAMHVSLAPAWYMEIGTETGASLARSKSRSVSVDPNFILKHDVWTNKDELHLFQTTSDAFFAEGHLDRLGARFGLAFLDGLHWYEYLLRDFINTEKYMEKGGCIVLHDCLPWSEEMADRDRSKVGRKSWTGDVWKVVPILQKYRPDLTVEVFDAAPTGLVVVRDLDPTSRTLSENYNEIIAEFDHHNDLEQYLLTQPVLPTSQSPWRPRYARARDKQHFAIMTSVPRPRANERWGDYHFAVGLKSALERLGHTATVRTKKHWHIVEDENEIDLIISGYGVPPRREGHLTLQWMIYSSKLADADHHFAASQPLLKDVQHRTTAATSSLLPQAFDVDRMPIPDLDQPRPGVVFVGLARDWGRPMVQYALETKADLRIWGPGWTETSAAPFVKSDRIDNRDVGQCYLAAEVVLNDHVPTMTDSAIPSNRIFDALACGAPVISDAIGWLPPEFEPYVARVGTVAEFADALKRIQSETSRKRKERHAFALQLRGQHSFDARAADIMQVVEEKLGQ